MPTNLNPYLNFRDNAREALTFYGTVLGTEPELTTFGDGGMSQGPQDADLIMHGVLTGPGGLVLMASDTPAYMEWTPGSSISVSISGDDLAELTGYGATITAPFVTAPWGDTFGMLVDKFGVGWLINASAPKE